MRCPCRIFYAASSWEIAIKYSLGKLRLPVPPSQDVPERLARHRIDALLVIEHSHALQVAFLPSHHHDPFDRLLIVQAMVEGLPIIGADHSFATYDIVVIWAQA